MDYNNDNSEYNFNSRLKADYLSRKFLGKLVLSIGIIVFLSSLVSQTLSAIVTYYFIQSSKLTHGNLEDAGTITYSIIIYLGLLFLVCILVGIIFSFLIIKLPLRPLSSFIEVINRLADGDFSARIDPKKYKTIHTCCAILPT